jgi:hypothetical protein
MGKIGYIIAGIVGAALGSGVTWFVTNKYWVDKNKKELEAYKTYFDGKIAELESREPKNESKPQVKNEVSRTENSRELKSYHSIISKHYNIDNVRTGDEDEDEELEKAAELMSAREIENKPKDKPYLIHMDAYNGDDEVHYQESYSHITLDYFSGDDVLVWSDTNQPIENVGRTVGWDWKVHFGDEKYGCDENCVYVRNDDREADYEIVRDKGYYCQIILGIDPPEEE